MTKVTLTVSLFAAMAFTATLVTAQPGTYGLDGGVTSSGGGNMGDLAGTLKISSTIGQPIAGQVASGGLFTVQTGFWTAAPLSPTAATVAVGGRVLDAAGQPLRNVSVMMTNSTGTIYAARTNAFGYFSFDEIQSGETYIVNLSSKGHQFVPQLLTVRGSLIGLEYRALN